MTPYTDPRDALAEMKRLNALAGRDDYTVVSTLDGFRVARYAPPIVFDPAYLAFRNWLRQQVYGVSNAVVRS